MGQEEDLRKRLEALERENRELKNSPGHAAAQTKTIQYSIGDFKGHPTITFEATGRRLTLGLRKAAIVLRCMEHIKAFVAENKGGISDWEVVKVNAGEKLSNNEDLKI